MMFTKISLPFTKRSNFANANLMKFASAYGFLNVLFAFSDDMSHHSRRAMGFVLLSWSSSEAELQMWVIKTHMH